MSRRYLRIKIDARVKECGQCEWRYGRMCCLFRDGKKIDTLLHATKGIGSDYARCAACLAAEVKP